MKNMKLPKDHDRQCLGELTEEMGRLEGEKSLKISFIRSVADEVAEYLGVSVDTLDRLPLTLLMDLAAVEQLKLLFGCNVDEPYTQDFPMQTEEVLRCVYPEMHRVMLSLFNPKSHNGKNKEITCRTY